MDRVEAIASRFYGGQVHSQILFVDPDSDGARLISC